MSIVTFHSRELTMSWLTVDLMYIACNCQTLRSLPDIRIFHLNIGQD